PFLERRAANKRAFAALYGLILARFHAIEPASACSSRQSPPYSAHEKTPLPAHAIPGPVPADRRLRHRRLRALSALSRGRVLDGRARLRRRPADHDLQDAVACDLSV